MKDRNHLYEFEMTALDGVVNKDAGVIKGVSVITCGIQAKGHNLEVDKTTIEQMCHLCQGKGQVPVKWNHRSGADAVNGFLTNFSIVGNKLKADWHLLKTHDKYETAMELAERMPKDVGFSASFTGLSELEDGRKVYPPNDETKYMHLKEGDNDMPVPPGEKIFARCDDVASVDLVAAPAANPSGMFSSEVDSPRHDMATKANTGETPDETKDAATILLGEFRRFAADTNKRLEGLESTVQELSGEEEEEEEPEPPGKGGKGTKEEDHEEFESLSDVLHYFETRLETAKNERDQQEFQAAYTTLESRVSSLLELNEQLAGENRLLAVAYKELSSKTKNVVEFAAGSDGQSRPVVRSTSGRKLTEFEARVEALKKDGKSAAEAMTFAVDEDLDRYTRHLESKGAFAQTL